MLSDTKARTAKPKDADYKLADEKGLFLLVRTSGSKLWRHKYRFAGKERLASYGAYPEVSIREAREQRDATRAMLREGRDPAIVKRRAAAVVSETSHTFESLAREWHELQADRWAPHHASDVLNSLERDVFPMLGEFPLKDIDTPLVLATLRPIERRGAVETAHRIRQRISAVFAYGISIGSCSTDPATPVQKALRPVPKARKQPAITDLAELRALLAATDQGGAYPVTLLASRFLAITAQRPGTVRRARWEDMKGIDWTSPFETSPQLERGEVSKTPDPVWHIPAEQMKLSLERKGDEEFDHVVPLPPAAVEVLHAVRALSGRGALVFPGQRHAHRPLSENAIGYLYNRAGWHGRHVPHGWRAAFSTVMNERRPADRAVIDLMLAHTPSNKVEAAYNRAEHMARRREIAEEWADLLMEGMNPAERLLTLARRMNNLSADVR